MGVRIIEGKHQAALYDSTSGVAFGPVFEGLDAHDQAVHFLDWLPDDPRSLDPGMLRAEHATWQRNYTNADYGELTAKAAAHVVSLL